MFKHHNGTCWYAHRVTSTPSEPTERCGDIPGAIRAEAARQNISRRHLAQQLGENRAWVDRRLTGRVAVTVEELCRIADVLGVRPLDLVPKVVAGV